MNFRASTAHNEMVDIVTALYAKIKSHGEGSREYQESFNSAVDGILRKEISQNQTKRKISSSLNQEIEQYIYSENLSLIPIKMTRFIKKKTTAKQSSIGLGSEILFCNAIHYYILNEEGSSIIESTCSLLRAILFAIFLKLGKTHLLEMCTGSNYSRSFIGNFLTEQHFQSHLNRSTKASMDAEYPAGQIDEAMMKLKLLPLTPHQHSTNKYHYELHRTHCQTRDFAAFRGKLNHNSSREHKKHSKGFLSINQSLFPASDVVQLYEDEKKIIG